MINGFIYILIANIINLLISLVNGFILPKYLSIETYAYIKMFQLYIQYIGFFHLGFVDGVYLEFGGKNIQDVDKKKFNSQVTFFLFLQIIISILSIIIGIIIKDNVFIIFALNIIPLNLATLYKYVYQATGEFKTYSNILNLTSIFNLIINLVLLFVFKVQNYILFLTFTTIINYIIILIVHKGIKKYFPIKLPYHFKIKEQLKYIYNGFFLMIGNFSSIILTSMDRWFIKLFLAIQDFAYYSFAISIEGLITTFTTPITITMYNYFCKNHSKENVTFIRNILFLAISALISSAFIVKGIINLYLTKYINAVNVIFILFAAQFFSIIIKGIYINLYKVERKQKTYFKKMLLIIIIGAILNLIFGSIYKCIDSYAYATLISFIIWFILCCFDFKYVEYRLKDILYISINIIAFIFLGLNTNFLIGFLIYLVFVFATSFLLFNKELVFIFNKGLDLLNKIIK